MKRFAAHYVYLSPERILKLHYVELDDANHLLGIFPLKEEMANTAFYNGVIVPVEKEGICEICLFDSLDSVPAKFSK